MKLDFPVEQTIKQRYSVRTYKNKPLTTEEKEQLNAYIQTLSSPFSTKPSFHFLTAKNAENAKKLGTYGVIKGAGDYIGATISKADDALPAMGYEFEKLILFATSIGLGTCWLGGTFNRSAFANAMSVKENDLFPAITPIGHSANKKRFADSLVRTIAKSDQRKDWKSLFFSENFSTPLTKEEAKDYAFPLEMIRLAPSASNKQPWRALRTGNTYHFLEEKTPGYSNRFSYDIQKLDVGIAICHFHMAVLEKGQNGSFQKIKPELSLPDHMEYILSWVAE